MYKGIFLPGKVSLLSSRTTWVMVTAIKENVSPVVLKLLELRGGECSGVVLYSRKL